MKNKKLWTVLLVAVLAFALGLGSMAFYTRVFNSNNNTVKTAKFKVSSNGTLDGDKKFDLTEEPIFPGVDLDVYEFEIDKKDTEVPVKYTVSVVPAGDLFEAQNGNPSPVKVSVLRKIGEGWTDIGGLSGIEIIPDEIIERFKIHIAWPHNDEFDADFEDLYGEINIQVVAKQVVGGTDPGDPDPDPDPEPGEITLAGITFTEKEMPDFKGGRVLRGILKADFENLPENARHYYVYYTNTQYNKEFREHGYIGNTAIIAPRAFIDGEKVDIEVLDTDYNILKRFNDVPLP